MNADHHLGAAFLGFYGAIACSRKAGMNPRILFDLVLKECFMFEQNEMVRFKKQLNARGYPLTGTIEQPEGEGVYSVNVFGLAGPGVVTLLHGVTAEDIERCGPPIAPSANQ